MTAQLAPATVYQAFAPNGSPLVGGKLFTYAAGTTTPQATYVDSTQTIQNTNPVILNASGQANVWLDPTLSYKFLLQDSAGNQVAPGTVDNIAGALAVLSLTVGPPIGNIGTITANGSTTAGANNAVVTINQNSTALGSGGLLITSSVAPTTSLALRNLVGSSSSFAEVALQGGSGTDNFSFICTNPSYSSGGITGLAGLISAVPGTHGAFPIIFGTGLTGTRLTIGAAGNIIIATPDSGVSLTVNGTTVLIGNTTVTGTIAASGAMGVNGASPPAQVTGWGTPTGPAVVNNFSGTAATLVQCSNAIAEIITYLKARGDFAA